MKTLEALQVLLEASYTSRVFTKPYELLSSDERKQKYIIVQARQKVMCHIFGMANGKPIPGKGSINKDFAEGNR